MEHLHLSFNSVAIDKPSDEQEGGYSATSQFVIVLATIVNKLDIFHEIVHDVQYSSRKLLVIIKDFILKSHLVMLLLNPRSLNREKF